MRSNDLRIIVRDLLDFFLVIIQRSLEVLEEQKAASVVLQRGWLSFPYLESFVFGPDSLESLPASSFHFTQESFVIGDHFRCGLNRFFQILP